ncbi:MAG TPA: FKBP-type peptidyl-prolyl cis-trans isomerase [bacterium]|nr:FKBP-type peptidyl-prolyl cis-trans isomerase [bacterium]HRQ69495.1 FKBP-type peptidyl-prolyl cis-trans isomerase [bacterium]
MKKVVLMILAVLLMITGCCKKCEEKVDDVKPAEPKKMGKYAADIEIISYRMGFDTAVTAFQSFPEMDTEAICKGVKDAAVKPVEPKYSDDVFNRSMARIRKDKISVDAEKRLGEYFRNQPVSEKYMKEAAKKKGLKKLEKGVLLEVLKEGTGDKVTIKDIAEVRYQGWDAKGTLFDSSFKRNRTSRFNLHDLIEGLRLAVLEMKKGGKYKVYIPEKAGYGTKGFKNRIEAGMALLFEIEIVNVERGKAKDPETETQTENADPAQLMKLMETKNDGVKKN